MTAIEEDEGYDSKNGLLKKAKIVNVKREGRKKLVIKRMGCILKSKEVGIGIGKKGVRMR